MSREVGILTLEDGFRTGAAHGGSADAACREVSDFNAGCRGRPNTSRGVKILTPEGRILTGVALGGSPAHETCRDWSEDTAGSRERTQMSREA